MDLASACVLLVGAVRQWTPIRQAALRGCHRTVPLSPDGWRSVLDCLRYGRQQGVLCVAACWPQMLAMLGLGNHGLPMVLLSLATLAERYFLRPVHRQFSVVQVALAMGIAARAMAIFQ